MRCHIVTRVKIRSLHILVGRSKNNCRRPPSSLKCLFIYLACVSDDRDFVHQIVKKIKSTRRRRGSSKPPDAKKITVTTTTDHTKQPIPLLQLVSLWVKRCLTGSLRKKDGSFSIDHPTKQVNSQHSRLPAKSSQNHKSSKRKEEEALLPCHDNYDHNVRIRMAFVACTVILLLPLAVSPGARLLSAQADAASCAALPIAKTEASGNEIGSVPSNVADSIPTTRWANFGKGSWISIDVGTLANICYIDVAWYRGDTRQNSFTLSLSSNPTSYTQVYAGQSSGKTTGFERYDFADVNARYVKITVNGNTKNDWAAIAEIIVYGDVSKVQDTTQPSITIDQPANNSQVLVPFTSPMATLSITGQAFDFGSRIKIVEVRTDDTTYRPATPASPGDWSTWTHIEELPAGIHEIIARATDNAGNQQWRVALVKIFHELSSTVPAAVSPGSRDRFGVSELYPTAPGGMEWSSKWDNGNARTFGNTFDPDDSWFETTHGIGTYTIDGKGTLTASGNFTRMYVHDPANVREWSENLEITMYIKRINETQLIDYSGLQLFARTNHGTNGNENMNFCDDRGYGVLVLTDGRWKFEKETAHHLTNGYVDLPGQKPWDELPKNTWIGVKYVLRNTDGNTNVKMELYRDLTNGLEVSGKRCMNLQMTVVTLG
jgi:hypothetical protein